jgi:hypothetical protein
VAAPHAGSSAVAPAGVSTLQCRIATLLVHGHGYYNPDVHDRHLRETNSIIERLGSDLFVVTDVPSSSFTASPTARLLEPSSFSRWPRAFGRVSQEPFDGDLFAHSRRVAAIRLGANRSNILLPAPPHRSSAPEVHCGVERASGSQRACGLASHFPQFYKALHAEHLLTLAETEDGSTYTVVLRLRLDATPLSASLWEHTARTYHTLHCIRALFSLTV